MGRRGSGVGTAGASVVGVTALRCGWLAGAGRRREQSAPMRLGLGVVGWWRRWRLGRLLDGVGLVGERVGHSDCAAALDVLEVFGQQIVAVGGFKHGSFSDATDRRVA